MDPIKEQEMRAAIQEAKMLGCEYAMIPCDIIIALLDRLETARAILDMRDSAHTLGTLFNPPTN